MKRIVFAAILVLFAVNGSASADQWANYTAAGTGLESDIINAICIDGNGDIWFGTMKGLTSFDGITWKTYNTDHNLAHNEVSSVAFEASISAPEIWIGTGGGVSVINLFTDAANLPLPFTTENTGLISNSVSSVAVDVNHVKWFGTDIGASSFNGDDWASYDDLNMLSVKKVLSIASAPDGWTYFGTDGGGVSRFDGVTTASPYDTDWSGIASDKVTAAYIAPDGVKWFGTDSGISRHAGTDTKYDWTTWSANDGLAGNLINAITVDLSGTVWAGTDGGASRYDGVSWKSFTTADGLAGNNVKSVAADQYGNIWFGTDSGVSKYTPDGVLVEDESATPDALSIRGCFPNPFNPETAIEYNIPAEGFVELAVYNLAGQKIRRLVYDTASAGMHTAVWDGRDEDGETVSSGIYISHLRMGSISTSSRMVLVK